MSSLWQELDAMAEGAAKGDQASLDALSDALAECPSAQRVAFLRRWLGEAAQGRRARNDLAEVLRREDDGSDVTSWPAARYYTLPLPSPAVGLHLSGERLIQAQMEIGRRHGEGSYAPPLDYARRASLSNVFSALEKGTEERRWYAFRWATDTLEGGSPWGSTVLRCRMRVAALDGGTMPEEARR